MQKGNRVAINYAKALSESFPVADDLAVAYDALDAMVQYQTMVPQLGVVFATPAVPRADKYSLVDKILPQANAKVKSLLKLLIANNRWSILPRVLKELELLLNNRQGTSRVTISARGQISASARQQLTATLMSHFATQPLVTYLEDQTLGGGVRLKIGNLVINNTVKSRLQNIRRTFKSGG